MNRGEKGTGGVNGTTLANPNPRTSAGHCLLPTGVIRGGGAAGPANCLLPTADCHWGRAERGRNPPRFGRRVVSRHRRAIVGRRDACPTMPSSFTSAGRSPRRPPLPPLFVMRCLVVGVSMATSDTEAGSWFVVVEAGYEAGGWKLETRNLMEIQTTAVASSLL